MKKLLYVRLIVMTTSFFINAATFAQSSASDIASIGKSGSAATASASSDEATLAAVKTSSSKMYNHFTKNYKNATDLKVNTVKDHTRISFKLNGISTSSQYDAKGRWQFTIRHYDESKLSDDTRASVESNYPGFLVFGSVVEVQVKDKSATLVMIENKKEWKRIRINDEGMSIYEQYRKQ